MLLTIATHSNNYFAHKNHRFWEFLRLFLQSKLARFRCSLVVRSALHTRTSTSAIVKWSSRAVHQFYSFPLAEHWSSYYCEHLSTKQTLTSFTVEPFNIYFEDLMWLFTHLCRLDKQDRRLKISLPWHLPSSLKTFTVESNVLTNNFFGVVDNCNTFEQLLCTQEPSTPRISDTGTPGWR